MPTSKAHQAVFTRGWLDVSDFCMELTIEHRACARAAHLSEFRAQWFIGGNSPFSDDSHFWSPSRICPDLDFRQRQICEPLGKIGGKNQRSTSQFSSRQASGFDLLVNRGSTAARAGFCFGDRQSLCCFIDGGHLFSHEPGRPPGRAH